MALLPKTQDDTTMRKTFKYRLFVDKRQQHILDFTLEECRWLYNDTLAYRKNAWEQEQRHANWYETKARIPLLKEQRPSLKEVYSQILQNVTERVDLAFQHFFRRVKAGDEPGYPRFKGYGRYASITYAQTGFKLDQASGVLELSKIGSVKIVLHRPLEGKIKTLTLTRSATGKWYACFSVEVEKERLQENKQVVGIDVGLHVFAALSDGQAIENPRFFRQEEKELAKVQHKLSKAEKGTKERAKRRKIVARTHERISLRRSNFAHQQSRKIVNGYGVIAVEDLNINRLNKLRHLAKSIMDAAWSQFFRMIRAKAEEAGRRFIAVNPAYTSQTCSKCGYRQKMPLSNRVFECPNCQVVLDRDHNASLNISGLGLQSLGLALEAPAFTPGE
jgi:putative transposase